MATSERPENAATSSGLDANLAAALAYVFGAITGVLMLVVEGDDEYVRFHAIQSIAVTIAFVALYLVLGIVIVVVSLVPVLGPVAGLILGLLYPLIALVGFGVWVLLLYKAYSGDRYQLPVVGSYAANQ